MIYEHSIEIERPIEEVFEVGTCTHRCVVWQPTPSSRLDGDGPARVGSTFRREYRFLGITYRVKAIITELVPPINFAFKSIEGPDFYARYTFTPTERGTCFRMAYETEELPAPIRLILNNRLVKKAVENIMKENFEQLKVLMEDGIDLWILKQAPSPST